MPTFKVTLSVTLEASDREAAVRKTLDLIEVLPTAASVTIEDLEELRGRRYFF